MVKKLSVFQLCKLSAEYAFDELCQDDDDGAWAGFWPPNTMTKLSSVLFLHSLNA